MESNTHLLDQLSIGLPRSFDFYHLGQVREINNNVPDLKNKTGVAFNVYSTDDNSQACVIAIFDSRLDVSMYTEMGNIMASHATGNIKPAMMTPPRILNELRLRSILENRSELNYRSFVHDYQNQAVPVHIAIVPFQLPEVADV